MNKTLTISALVLAISLAHAGGFIGIDPNSAGAVSSADGTSGSVDGAPMATTQEKIADSWIQIEQFRLLVLRTAWLIDKHHDYQKVRRDIAAVKVAMPAGAARRRAQRALHLHGALGVSDEMPFVKMMVAAESLGIADGATERLKMTVARRTLREYTAGDNAFPVGAHTDAARGIQRPTCRTPRTHSIAEF